MSAFQGLAIVVRRDQGDESSVHWLLSGRVQGVGFRWFVCNVARRHAMHGDVRNLPDGRVELRASGGREEMERFLDEVRAGAPGSRVDGIESLTAEQGLSFDGFDVRH